MNMSYQPQVTQVRLCCLIRSLSPVTQLIRKFRNPDNKLVLQAIEELRARGWLDDGSLRQSELRCVHLQGADLCAADLQGVNLRQANLQEANLSMADLRHADLGKANLKWADLSRANLEGADLFRANLEGARNVTEDQLASVARLNGAILPDGTLYNEQMDFQKEDSHRIV